MSEEEIRSTFLYLVDDGVTTRGILAHFLSRGVGIYNLDMAMRGQGLRFSVGVDNFIRVSDDNMVQGFSILSIQETIAARV